MDALDLSVLSVEFGRILSFQSRLSIHYKDFSYDLGVSQSPFRNCTDYMYVNPQVCILNLYNAFFCRCRLLPLAPYLNCVSQLKRFQLIWTRTGTSWCACKDSALLQHCMTRCRTCAEMLLCSIYQGCFMSTSARCGIPSLKLSRVLLKGQT